MILPTGLTALASAPAPTLWMPRTAAKQAENVDGIFYFIYWVSVIAFILVVGVMAYFVWRYRRRGKEDRTSPIEGNTRLEIAWSVVPSIFLVVMFLWGFRDWMSLNVPPDDAMDIRVTGQKWNWSFDYPRQGCTGVSEMTVPVDTPVKLTMSSRDVIHSFYVPAFRIKRDVLPNRYSVIWFEATHTGTYDVLCTEYCGTQHSKMLSKVTVLGAADYAKWVEDGCGMGGTPVEMGEKLFKARCTACHSLTKERNGLPGPPMGGRYGTMEETLQGTVKVDDNYMRESIMEPQAKIVKGYAPVMPTFKGQLSDKQVNAIIDYVKTLK